MILTARGKDWGSLSQPPCKLCASILMDISVSPKGVQASVSKAASSNLSKSRSFLYSYLLHDTPLELLSGGLSGLEGLAFRAWAAKRQFIWEMPGPWLYSCTHLCYLIIVCGNTGVTQQPERMPYPGYVCTVHIFIQIPHTFISICILVHICLHIDHTHSYLYTHTYTLIYACTYYTCSYLYIDHTHAYIQTMDTHIHTSHTFTSAHIFMGIQTIHTHICT